MPVLHLLNSVLIVQVNVVLALIAHIVVNVYQLLISITTIVTLSTIVQQVSTLIAIL